MVSKIYCFDLDNTLCLTEEIDYATAKPILPRIEVVNRLFDSGHIIKIFTARGSETGIDWSSLTKSQLSLWGVKHHEIIFGKPAADIYIDDKAIGLEYFDNVKESEI